MPTSQIKEGARFINQNLNDKGYFSSGDSAKKLLFNSIDINELREASDDQEEVITNTMLENDKHVINVIYDLLDQLEKTRSIKEGSILQYQQQVHDILKLQKQNEFLNNKLQLQQEKLDEKDMEIVRLNSALKIANQDKHLMKKDRNQLKLINENLKEKQKMEIKKKNIEIDQLRDKLIIKLNSISYA